MLPSVGPKTYRNQPGSRSQTFSRNLQNLFLPHYKCLLEKSGKHVRLSVLPTHTAHDELLWLGWLGQGQFGEMPALVAQVWDVDALQAEQDRQCSAMMQVVG